MSGIVRYEQVTINEVTNGISTIGEYTTTLTPWFETKALVHNVANSLRISEKYRVYSDLINITINFTPWAKTIVDNQNQYSITWRDFDWRITEVRETNDRMKVTLLCYRNDPDTPV